MDFETTGVDTSRFTNARPIEIGCVFTDSELNVLADYTKYIKWDSIIDQENWNDMPGFDGSYSQLQTYNVHKIKLDDIKMQGRWPYEIRHDLQLIIKRHVKCVDRKPVIISDAPNFEMFWTRFIFGGSTWYHFPFHYNAWSIYPTLQLFGIDIEKISTQHDALSDAYSMRNAMDLAYKKAHEFKLMKG